MDTTNHAIEGFLITFIPGMLLFPEYMFVIIVISLISCVWGALPDAIPDLYAKYVGQWNKWSQNFYDRAHSYKIWWLNIIPGSLLHIFLDSFGHGEGKRWYIGYFHEYLKPWLWREAMWLQSTTWAVNIILIIFTVWYIFVNYF